MSVIRKCEFCGMPYELEFGVVAICKYCGEKHLVSFNEDAVTRIQQANKYRLDGFFDDAIKIYCDLLSKYPKSAELHFGKFLAEFGVSDTENVEDDFHELLSTKATCVFEDENFKNCIELDANKKKEYQRIGELVEQKRRRNVKLLENISENSYSAVMICSEDKSSLTLASEIYSKLNRNFDFYYSEETAKKLNGKDKLVATLLAVQKAPLLYVVAKDLGNFDESVKKVVKHFLKFHKRGYLCFVSDDERRNEISDLTEKRIPFNSESQAKILQDVMTLSSTNFREYQEFLKTQKKLKNESNPSPIINL